MAKIVSKTDPIRIETPYAVLNVAPAGNYDVGAPVVLGAPVVNMWAKYKPMVPRIDHPNELTDSERAEVNFGLALYKGDNPVADTDIQGNINLDIVTAANELPLYLWKYSGKPGDNNWKRLTDWMGYNGAVTSPVSPCGDFIVFNDVSEMTIHGYQQPAGTGNITLADFPFLFDKYFAVIVYFANSSTGATSAISYVTAAETISSVSNNDSVSISRQTLRNLVIPSGYNEIRYVMCACTLAKTDFSSENVAGATFSPLPCDRPLVGKIDVSAESPAILTIYGISDTSTQTPEDISIYMPGKTSPKYFGAAGGIRLYCSVVSNGSRTTTIRPQSITASVDRTLSTSETFAGRVSAKPSRLYRLSSKNGGTMTEITTSLSVLANTTYYIAIDLPRLAYLDDDGVDSLAIRDRTAVNGTINIVNITSQTDSYVAGTFNINIHQNYGDD